MKTQQKTTTDVRIVKLVQQVIATLSTIKCMGKISFNHFSIGERELIQIWTWEKRSIRYMAKELNRSPSSVCRELKKNRFGRNIYIPRAANQRALEKRKSRGRKERLKNLFVRTYVVAKLKNDNSPEQIAGRLSIDYPKYSVSHEAIYQYIYAQIHRDGYGYPRPDCEDLRMYLPRRHKRRRPYYARMSQKLKLCNRISIDMRPAYIDLRKQQGHWEGDSMGSQQSKVGVNTLNERVSGLVMISRIKNKKGNETARVVMERMKMLPLHLRRTLTLDNGPENAGHEEISKELKISCYFAHPYCSGERGSNENTNGLIRRYLPKKTDFATVSDETINWIEQRLNNRPRKRLGWRTPLEVFNSGVAITG